MRNFIYRFPVTDLNVQGSADDRDTESEAVVPQTCLACGEVHLVDPGTGQLVSEKFHPGENLQH
jgi:hypothetical protein